MCNANHIGQKDALFLLTKRRSSKLMRCLLVVAKDWQWWNHFEFGICDWMLKWHADRLNSLIAWLRSRNRDLTVQREQQIREALLCGLVQNCLWFGDIFHHIGSPSIAYEVFGFDLEIRFFRDDSCPKMWITLPKFTPRDRCCKPSN